VTGLIPMFAGFFNFFQTINTNEVVVQWYFLKSRCIGGFWVYKKVGLLINRRKKKEKQFLTWHYGCQGYQEKLK
jgi:hypothetical protein